MTGITRQHANSESIPLLSSSCEEAHYVYSYQNSREEEGERAILELGASIPKSEDQATGFKMKFKLVKKKLKLFVLTIIMLFCVVSLSFIKVHDYGWNSIALVKGKTVKLNVTGDSTFKREIIHMIVKGPFIPGSYSSSQDYVSFSISMINSNGTYRRVSKPWTVLLGEDTHESEDNSIVLEHNFNLKADEISDIETYQISITTNKKRDFVSMSVILSVQPKLAIGRILMALCVLIVLYLLLILEVVHRTLAAMIGATTAISCLAIVGERPSLSEVLTWVDVETLSLLFGMMVLVSILCETGFFDYIAVLTYRLARGQIWPLITGLCLVTAVLSAFLDNVTTVLLMSAVAIRLCETMNLDPKHMLIALVIFSNIGGAATPIGDPPNVIIINHKKIVANGIDFGTFTLHMAPAVLLCTAVSYVLLRIMYRNTAGLRFRDPPEVVEMKHELEVWKKAYRSHSGYSKEEDGVKAILKRKMAVIETKLANRMDVAVKISEADFRANLIELRNTFKVKDPTLLWKSGIVIGIVIIFFFLESIPQLNLSLGWIAILGAIFLLVLGDFDELESVLGRVEWSTLVFFAALFIVMEALSRLELVLYIVNTTEDIINSVDESHKLLVAIVLILWISALSSSVIDNIPFTTVMVQVIADIADKEKTSLPLRPLVFALALGACLGGNGTLIGASANLVTAGVAEQHGYRFSFYDFFRIGFPIMLLTTTISTFYLVVCHIWIGWNF